MSNTITKKVVKVAEYRLAIDSLSYRFASLRSAVNQEERVREAESVKSAARELISLECKRASRDDLDAADRLIDITAEYLLDAGLTRFAR